jgi:hypothetical protein
MTENMIRDPNGMAGVRTQARLRERLMIIVAVALGLALTAVHRGGADPPSCAPFNDVGCFFGEDWENGTTSGWGVNNPANFTNMTPGLNGTSRTALLQYTGIDSGIWADTAVNHTSPDGEVVFLEFYVRWASGFKWAAGPAGVPGAKTFEFFINPPAGCEGRLLMTVRADNSAQPQFGTPFWSLLTDTSCGGTGRWEAFPTSPFTVTSGITYRVIIAVKVANGPNGYLKTWFNGTPVHDAQNIQTSPTAGNKTWQYVRIGGAYADVGSPTSALYDQIRITTTNIAPAVVSAPSVPVILSVK